MSLTEIKTIRYEREFDKWFKENYEELGFTYIKRIARKRVPDYIAMRNGKLIRVELETLSSNFIKHGHDPEEVDLVLCVAADKEVPVKTEIVTGLKFWKSLNSRKPHSQRIDSKKVSDWIEALLREERFPLTSQQIAKRLNLPMNTVYYATTVLVAAEKIKRYMGLAGVFVLEEAEEKPDVTVSILLPAKTFPKKEAEKEEN